mmetsp:Transcript_7640/g.16353  ORF Transcript_7640/g.16353 Transcript_7640/m.16353 type:complete len:258 (+) Transcript_7640:805-1578(+)
MVPRGLPRRFRRPPQIRHRSLRKNGPQIQNQTHARGNRRLRRTKERDHQRTHERRKIARGNPKGSRRLWDRQRQGPRIQPPRRPPRNRLRRRHGPRTHRTGLPPLPLPRRRRRRQTPLVPRQGRGLGQGQTQSRSQHRPNGRGRLGLVRHEGNAESTALRSQRGRTSREIRRILPLRTDAGSEEVLRGRGERYGVEVSSHGSIDLRGRRIREDGGGDEGLVPMRGQREAGGALGSDGGVGGAAFQAGRSADGGGDGA